MIPPDEAISREANEKVRAAWAKRAAKYDKSIAFWERRVFGPGHREWACAQAQGATLEVAVGTGINVPLYDPSIELTGIDLSSEMLEIARERIGDARPGVALHEADAQALPFPDDSFDSVVCTYSLCNIPDPYLAVGEMKRVVRPGGRIVLVDHIRSDVTPVYWVQKAMEFLTRRLEGEHMTRRPIEHVQAHGLTITERARTGRWGVVERVIAVKDA